MGSTTCAQCGSTNANDANFCSVCGGPLDRHDADHTASHPVVSVPTPDEVPMVVVTRGANAGSRFALSDVTTRIGRHPESEVFLDDVTVSRRHAEIRRDGAVLTISDVGSLNGTYLNGSRVDTAALAEGDQVQVGKFKLVVVFGGGADE
ncbi:MAG: FHA domain-containing protein [Microthrixaceae bacterium]|jgi:hypothetical protein|nr:FHA domain-containing protein [Actinomycetota bacterium]MBP6728602.1 zinc-ribbon and FHA domain-containing protein [Microthrixaceae bacterium]HMS12855.1 FHA domain-containing protein [Microthrixaceae bacterium]HMT24682.1 FHA domain-containing protein [Microthrixaceae bacterium]HMT61616.1 FHA domain-containing protein [Microthrixaceae bacterium]